MQSARFIILLRALQRSRMGVEVSEQPAGWEGERERERSEGGGLSKQNNGFIV